jgi:uncharacterized protein (TIGR00730 family)
MTKLKSLCVFCGSRNGSHPDFEKAAIHLADIMAEGNIRLIYGGGGVGLMGATAKQLMACGGEVIGVIPDFLQASEGYEGITRVIVTRTMHERKQIMFDLAEAFVVLPGGIGTLDETIEMMTWRQLERHAKPIGLLNLEDYWSPLINLLTHTINQGFADPHIRDDLIVDGDPKALIEKIDAVV